jgi:hypothetical protein
MSSGEQGTARDRVKNKEPCPHGELTLLISPSANSLCIMAKLGRNQERKAATFFPQFLRRKSIIGKIWCP